VSNPADARSPAAPTTLTAAQQRIVTAALKLFSRHGVGGTSLQMIADEIGVTKAAVYHQYSTKDQIVLAAAEAELANLEQVVRKAEALAPGRKAQDVLVEGIVDLAIARRREMGNILTDPVIADHFAGDEVFADVMHRLRRLVAGDESGPEARVRTATLIGAISGAVMHPFVAGLDDEVLRGELLRLARRFLGLPN
jgi:AcrR family transcriptional regulator